MIILLSPAKNLDFKTIKPAHTFTQPLYLKESKELVAKMRKFSKKALAELMDINPKLASLNYDRFRNWDPEFTPANSKPALFAFNGDVYHGLKAKTLDKKALDFAQGSLVILSGLHGLLRPLDLIQPYRLEMSTEIKLGKAKSLVEFWSGKVTASLNEMLKSHKSKTIINLASNEYSQCIDQNKLDADWITPTFKELRGDGYQIFFIFLKRARGMMARFIIENRIIKPTDIKAFDMNGYAFSDPLSKGKEWMFVR